MVCNAPRVVRGGGFVCSLCHAPHIPCVHTCGQARLPTALPLCHTKWSACRPHCVLWSVQACHLRALRPAGMWPEDPQHAQHSLFGIIPAAYLRGIMK
jgi:hypothetical protein